MPESENELLLSLNLIEIYLPEGVEQYQSGDTVKFDVGRLLISGGYTVSWLGQSSVGFVGTLNAGGSVKNLCVNGNASTSYGTINYGLVENCGSIGNLGATTATWETW